MSGNNQIIIQKRMYEWTVMEVDVDSYLEGHDKGSVIYKTDDLERAIKEGNKYMKNNEVEYGLQVITD